MCRAGGYLLSPAAPQEIGYDQLEVLEGERMTVHIRYDDEWWLVEMDSGDIGLVPGTYCDVFEDGIDPYENNAGVLNAAAAFAIAGAAAGGDIRSMSQRSRRATSVEQYEGSSAEEEEEEGGAE